MGEAAQDIVLAQIGHVPTHGWRLRDSMARLGRDPDSVYKVLRRLRDLGLVVEVGERTLGDAGAPRVQYAVTPSGRERIETWIRTPLDRDALGADLLARMHVARPDQLPTLLEAAHEQLVSCAALLAGASAQRSPLSTPDGDCHWDAELELLDEDRKMTALQGYVSWLRRVCRALEARIATGGE